MSPAAEAAPGGVWVVRGAAVEDGDVNPSWMAVGEALEFMCERGSCVELSYDEESAVWEVMWITDGRRFVAHDASPLKAATNVLGQATAYMEGLRT